jgi:phosphatidylserine decarboxylase
MVLKGFARYYRVNMQESQHPELSAYASFNEFFVRRCVTAPARSSATPTGWPCPQTVPSASSARIHDDQIFQAKGHNYSLEALLAGNYVLAEPFRNGLFATTYLAPRDYHRVHMPCNGVLREMIYVPGDLFSVNPIDRGQRAKPVRAQ